MGCESVTRHDRFLADKTFGRPYEAGCRGWSCPVPADGGEGFIVAWNDAYLRGVEFRRAEADFKASVAERETAEEAELSVADKRKRQQPVKTDKSDMSDTGKVGVSAVRWAVAVPSGLSADLGDEGNRLVASMWPTRDEAAAAAERLAEIVASDFPDLPDSGPVTDQTFETRWWNENKARYEEVFGGGQTPVSDAEDGGQRGPKAVSGDSLDRLPDDRGPHWLAGHQDGYARRAAAPPSVAGRPAAEYQAGYKEGERNRRVADVRREKILSDRVAVAVAVPPGGGLVLVRVGATWRCIVPAEIGRYPGSVGSFAVALEAAEHVNSLRFLPAGWSYSKDDPPPEMVEAAKIRAAKTGPARRFSGLFRSTTPAGDWVGSDLGFEFDDGRMPTFKAFALPEENLAYTPTGEAVAE